MDQSKKAQQKVKWTEKSKKFRLIILCIEANFEK